MDIQSVSNIKAEVPSLQSPAEKPNNFAALMQHYVQQTNEETQVAHEAAVDLALGKDNNVSETMLAIQKADLSFQLMVGVRNKLVDAYREVMRMQV